MVQQAVRVEAPPLVERPSGGRPTELGRDWVIRRDCRLRPSDRGGLPTVLIHPARGIAVLDMLPSATPDAAEAVRARLRAARFPAIFAGHLPVVHLRVTPRQMPFLPALLDDTFAAQPPLRLPGGDAWVGVAARALLAEQPVPRLASRRVRGADPARRQRRRRRAAALRTIGAVLLSVAALGGVLGAVLNVAPPAPAPAPESAPASVAAIAPMAAGEAGSLEAALPALPAAPEPLVPAAPMPVPARDGAEVAAPPPEEASSPAPSPPPPSASPAPPQRGAAPPPNRRAPDRATPRWQQDAGAAPSSTRAVSPPPEAEPDRCRRVSALVGSGAPLGEADMRFFNEACIRW